MNEIAHATQAQALITIVAALIPLLIWAFKNAETKLAPTRAKLTRRRDRRD